jgi:hypothetical protein
MKTRRFRADGEHTRERLADTLYLRRPQRLAVSAPRRGIRSSGFAASRPQR